jgi:vancomycin resistance protein YoaR
MAAEEIDLVDVILGKAAAADWEAAQPDSPETTAPGAPAPEATAPEPPAPEATAPEPPAPERTGLYAPDESESEPDEPERTGLYAPDESESEPDEPESTAPEATAAKAAAAEAPAPESTSIASVAEPVSDQPEPRLDLLPRPQLELHDRTWPRPRLRRPHIRLGAGWRRVHRIVGFGLAFALGALATLAILAAVAIGITGAYSDRVVPGVHVGAVYLSGLTRDQVVARLQTAYAYLGQGDVIVTTPAGSVTLTYEQLGRGPNVQFMADEAMRIGHTGNRIADAITMLRTAVGAESVPVVAQLNPTAVATSVRGLKVHDTVPQEAQAWTQGTTFTYSNSSVGRGIDEAAICGAILDHLSQSDAPAVFRAGGAFLELKPRVTDADAQAAIGAAERMAVNVTLEFGGDNPAPSSSQAAAQPTSLVIDSDTVRGWIVFQTGTGGRYGPAIDPGPVQAYLSSVSGRFQVAPVEPTILFDSSGVPLAEEGGRDGKTMDVAATAAKIADYLDKLSLGDASAQAITVTTQPIVPNLALNGLGSMVEIGGWQTTFYPDVSNGYGANIRTPAKLLNGQVVEPGQRFSFLTAVGPIDAAHGYTMGGVIEQGKSDHTGAMGGGICSASTTMFNAAARAGLEIDERHPHYYYIYRYPVGLDATVFTNGYQVWDLQWTNDTPNPILIVANSTYGSASVITIQLWSLPLNRTVTFSPEFKANVVPAGDYTVYSTSLPVGQSNRAEYPTDGFDTSRTRTVTDSSGKVIHTDTWDSHYSMVNGLLVVGSAPARAPAPLPGAPQPAALPAPAGPAVAPRRAQTGGRPRALSR